nr:pentapeptide repeat-containing protein [Massilia genomosp. 1]
MAGSDLRSSLYAQVNFAGADLSKADLRLSSFESCDFRAAAMDGTVLTFEQGKALVLSDEQRAVIAWTSDCGEEPSGG